MLKFGESERCESTFLSPYRYLLYLGNSQYTSISHPSHLGDSQARSNPLFSHLLPIFLSLSRMQLDSPQEHEGSQQEEEEEARQPWELTRAGKRIAELKEIEDVRSLFATYLSRETS